MTDFNMPPGVPARDIPGNGDDAWREEGDMQAHAVVTLRDWFAAAALPALMSAVAAGTHTTNPGLSLPDGIALDAYGMADAMLEVRQS